MKMYIAVLDEFPDYMTPTLVAHTVLIADEKFKYIPSYAIWREEYFKKCVVRVNRKEFNRICELPYVATGHEKHTLNGEEACAIVLPCYHDEDIPKVLKFAKLWSPKEPQ